MTSAAPRRQPPTGPVVFDCDGILIDTEPAWARAYTLLFDRYRKPFGATQRQALLGCSLGALGRLLERFLDQPGQAERLGDDALCLARAELRRGVKPFPGAIGLVADLRGRRPLGVASNAPRPHLLHLLAGAGFDGAFDVIVASDDVQHPKPAPDLYLHACQRLHADPSTVIAVEDSPAGVQAARAAGLYVIAIPNSPSVAPDADLFAGSLASPHVRAALGLPATPARRTSTRPTPV